MQAFMDLRKGLQAKKYQVDTSAPVLSVPAEPALDTPKSPKSPNRARFLMTERTKEGGRYFAAELCSGPNYCYTYGSGKLYTGSCTGKIYVFRLPHVEASFTIDVGRKTTIKALAISTPPVDAKDVDQTLLSVADNQLQAWNAKTGQAKYQLTTNGNLDCLAMRSDCIWLGTTDGRLQCFDLPSKNPISSHKLHTMGIKGIAVHDGVAYTAGLDGLLKGLDVERQALVTCAGSNGGSSLRSLKYTHAETTGLPCDMIFVGQSEGDICGYDPRTSRCEVMLKGHKDAVMTLESEKFYLLSGSDDKKVMQWDLRTNTHLHTYLGNRNSAVFVHLIHDGKAVMSCDLSRNVRAWKLVHAKSDAVSDFDADKIDPLSKVKAVFRNFSTTPEGSSNAILTPVAFKAALDKLNIPNLKLCHVLFQDYDQNLINQVLLEEVLNAIEYYYIENQGELFKSVFRVFDQDGSGEISYVEVGLLKERGTKTMERLGCNERLLKEFAFLLKSEAGGEIDFKEFCEYMNTRPELVKSMFPVVLVCIAGMMDLSWDKMTPDEEKQYTKKYFKTKKLQAAGKNVKNLINMGILGASNALTSPTSH